MSTAVEKKMETLGLSVTRGHGSTQLIYRGKPTSLAPRELEFLELLVLCYPSVLQIEAVSSTLKSKPNAVKLWVYSVRKALSRCGSPYAIATSISPLGYSLLKLTES